MALNVPAVKYRNCENYRRSCSDPAVDCKEDDVKSRKAHACAHSQTQLGLRYAHECIGNRTHKGVHRGRLSIHWTVSSVPAFHPLKLTRSLPGAEGTSRLPVALTQSTPIQIALNTLMRNAGPGEKDSPRVTRKKRRRKERIEETMRARRRNERARDARVWQRRQMIAGEHRNYKAR